MSTDDLPRANWISVLGWAFYLACSWTWCIGMFLPVILVRDYGVWGWIVFAVPNVAGAAAMGWVIRSQAQSESLVQAHWPAMIGFSFVTVAFQVFFGWWMFHQFGGGNFFLVMMAFALLGVVYPMANAPRSGPWIAAVVFLGSCACIVQLARSGALDNPVQWLGAADGIPAGAACLAPVSILGFLLCPYLDLTFHQARQELGKSASRIAFTVGFAVLFLCMILFTLSYANALIAATSTDSRWIGGRVIFAWLQIHFLLQLGFTIGIHLQRGAALLRRMNLRAFGFTLGSIALGMVAAIAVRWLPWRPIEPGELVYRVFMGFYGLVCPAYVWLVMIPTRPGRARHALNVFAGVILLAAPFYWLGFVQGRMFWLLPGLAVVLLSRVAGVPFRGRQNL